jgi:hypothetical protein
VIGVHRLAEVIQAALRQPLPDFEALLVLQLTFRPQLADDGTEALGVTDGPGARHDHVIADDLYLLLRGLLDGAQIPAVAELSAPTTTPSVHRTATIEVI